MQRTVVWLPIYHWPNFTLCYFKLFTVQTKPQALHMSEIIDNAKAVLLCNFNHHSQSCKNEEVVCSSCNSEFVKYILQTPRIQTLNFFQIWILIKMPPAGNYIVWLIINRTLMGGTGSVLSMIYCDIFLKCTHCGYSW